MVWSNSLVLVEAVVVVVVVELSSGGGGGRASGGGRISAETLQGLDQVAGGGATCYYHGDTTQRGIVQILIQGSIFIDSNSTMRRSCALNLESAISVSQSHHSSGSAPLASSRSQLLREFIVRVGAGGINGSWWGPWGLVPT